MATAPGLTSAWSRTPGDTSMRRDVTSEPFRQAIGAIAHREADYNSIMYPIAKNGYRLIASDQDARAP